MTPSHLFDYEHWLKKINPSLEQAVQWTTHEGATGPRQFVAYRTLRDKIAREQGILPAGSTRAIVLGIPELLQPGQTQVGGVPYRPAHLPWPCDRDCRPGTFLVQFRIREPNLRSQVPGDLLLVFCHDFALGWPDSDEQLTLEWQCVQSEESLLTADQMPQPAKAVPHLAGLECEMDEYDLAAIPVFEKGLKEYVADEWDRFLLARALCIYPNAKVGGSPLWLNDHQREFARRCEAEGAAFVAGLGTIFPDYTEPYPLVGWQGTTMTWDERSRQPGFYCRDGHVLNFWSEPTGKGVWSIDFY
jgi:hypothetical protein